MSLTLGSTTFGEMYGRVQVGAYEVVDIRAAFPGTIGESQLLDWPKGRQIIVPYRPAGTNEANLWSKLEALARLAGTLHGTLNRDGVTFPKTTFLGFFPSRPVLTDGSGVNGWFQQGQLVFRQLSYK